MFTVQNKTDALFLNSLNCKKNFKKLNAGAEGEGAEERTLSKKKTKMNQKIRANFFLMKNFQKKEPNFFLFEKNEEKNF